MAMTETEKLRFSVQRSVRYHNHRRRFYEVWNSVTVTVAAIGGTLSMATSFPLGNHESFWWIPAITSLLVGLFGAVDLCIGTARCANIHLELAKKFIAIEQDLAHGRELEGEELEIIIKVRLEIEATEPPIMRFLDLLCHFELLRAQGDKKKHPEFPRWRRKVAHWFSQNDYTQKAIQKYHLGE